MMDRDYLWCVLHMMLDDEEAVEDLCPACRAQAEQRRCPVCGTGVGEMVRGKNDAFDWERFEKLRKGAEV